MKFLDVLKRYNNAVIKENAKLKSIYDSLISESTIEVDDNNEVKTCDNTQTTDVNENDFVEASKYFTVCEEEKTVDEEEKNVATKEIQPSESENIEEKDVADSIPESDFFGIAETAKKENEITETDAVKSDDNVKTEAEITEKCEKCGNAPCTCEAETEIDETEVDLQKFFDADVSEEDKSKVIDQETAKNESSTELAENDLMTWEEFTKLNVEKAETAEKCEKCGNAPCTCDTEAVKENENTASVDTVKTETEAENESEDIEENDMLKNKPHNAHISIADDELNESIEIDEYRKANYRLFNS